jgi:alanine racemase
MAYIKIDKDNFFYNLTQFTNRIGSKDKIAIVLKDNAYGHGLDIMAKLSYEFGLTHAVVRNIKEADRIKGYFSDILILGDKAIFNVPFSFALNSLDDIKQAQKGAKVELKIDTGMHRNGISINEIEIALKLIDAKELNLIGVMSHNRSADELSSELFWQQKNFKFVKSKMKSFGIKNIRFHSYNSASALRLNCKDEDLIRLGIGAYGYNELPSIYSKSLQLKPVLSLYAKKVSTRELKRGQRIGYGGDFITPKDMVVSTYDLGYGDGWIRGDSKSPFITAEALPILGRVSMDYISLETTKGEVCIFDNAQKASQQLNTISYELLTQLSKDIKRTIY